MWIFLTLTKMFYLGYFIANKKVFFVIGLLMNVDPYFFVNFNLLFMLFIVFIFLNKMVLFKNFSKNEMKFMDNIFYIFLISNIFGLSAFYMSYPLWPVLMVSLSFCFWLQSVFSLLKISFINFISHFSQENLMILMTCFMVYIEMLSITIRFLTLAFRLLANILGGHLMMELAFVNSGNTFLMMGLFSYELFVAMIQAVIYSILIYYYTVESMEKY